MTAIALVSACGSDSDSDTASTAAAASTSGTTGTTGTTGASATTEATGETEATGATESTGATEATEAAEPTGEPIKIMQIVTASGPSNNVPEDAVAGSAAADAVNAAGGIQGHPLEFIQCDDKFDPNGAADCARQAVEEEVSAVVALNSAFGDKVIPILEAAGIPSVGDNLITSAEFVSPMVFPITGGALTGTAAMEYATARAGATKIRPLIVDVPAAKGLLPFIQGAAALFPDSTLLPDIAVPPTTSDVTAQASAAAADGADGAFFVVGQGGGAPLARAMRSAGFTGILTTSTQSITLSELKDLGDQATGMLLVSAMPPPSYTENASVQQFHDDLDAAGYTDERTGGMLTSWTSVKVLALGLSKATAFDAAGVVDALSNYGEFEFPGLGTWDYSKPLAAFGGSLRVFNPNTYISEVDSSGAATPIDPEPFDVTTPPTK